MRGEAWLTAIWGGKLLAGVPPELQLPALGAVGLVLVVFAVVAFVLSPTPRTAASVTFGSVATFFCMYGVIYGVPPAARLPALLGAAIVASAVVVWRMTLAADARTPRMRIATITPLLTGPRGLRTRLRDVPGVIRGAALVLAILALGRPQNVLRGESGDDKGIDIVIVLDLSGSMRALMDADDSATRRPDAKRLTRLETAKEVILDFVARRKSDRIGVVVFGRSAFILSPPTLDKSLLSTLVSKMELGIIDGNGTAIGDAVGTAVARLRRSNARSKAIILLTDGDSNAGSIAPDYAAHLAQTQAVRVYTVQIGNGDDVDVQEGVDLFGQPKFVREHFPVNPELLKRMASTTGGDAFVATDKKGLEQSMHAILDKLEKTRFEAQATTMEDLFPFLLLPAVALLALEALVRIFVVRRFP
jgi:Ca-activated chloride channel family protein